MAKVTCCMSIRRSKFCPDCGKQLVESNAADEILAHIRKNVRNFQTRIENLEGREERGDASFRSDQLTYYKKVHAKWTRWEEAQVRLMQNG